MNKRMERVLGIRQSGAAGPHRDRRQRRRRTRQAELDFELDDVFNTKGGQAYVRAYRELTGQDVSPPRYVPGVWWRYDLEEGWIQVDPPEGV